MLLKSSKLNSSSIGRSGHAPGCPCCSGVSLRKPNVFKARGSAFSKNPTPANGQLVKPAAPQAASVSSPSQNGTVEKPVEVAELHARMAAQQMQLQQLTQALETMGKTALSAVGVHTPASASEQPAPGVLSIEQRAAEVRKSFPNALAVDDFMNRVEVALADKGFTGNNTIAMSNLCR
eukprot:CAMPEP_0202419456 /NCGR_PEP_ID=MMETSP1128-20130828/49309_1 /ASSEMBLY_ACC=CAM_ASM_000463 /TAXON_ID=3047 /ORGANISM="Dunaliella tertiolecta, Strain CCMP1320" /LENGTH=177 /DNA_ID=CAMNT_0049027403 /DNA_START=524 /DNA_END=1054 /DNA_ORIENTATION=-